MTSFDDAVRALARREGHDVADDQLVEVIMSEEWSGYSEYTITNVWDSFQVRCGSFERDYENDNECRQRSTMPGGDYRPAVALAKLWADLAPTPA